MRVLVVLEDGRGRVDAICAWLENREDDLELAHRTNAPDMIAWLEEGLSRASLITLDYHLGGAGPGCGSGMDVALWLSKQAPVCPVIVHTSDVTAGRYVSEVLEEAGWVVVQRPFSREGWAALAEEFLG